MSHTDMTLTVVHPDDLALYPSLLYSQRACRSGIGRRHKDDPALVSVAAILAASLP
jgi:hypothetical protein